MRRPWVGTTPWRRAWQSTPVFLAENPMDRVAWRATSPQDHKNWRRPKWPSTLTNTHYIWRCSWALIPTTQMDSEMPSQPLSCLLIMGLWGGVVWNQGLSLATYKACFEVLSFLLVSPVPSPLLSNNLFFVSRKQQSYYSPFLSRSKKIFRNTTKHLLKGLEVKKKKENHNYQFLS